MLPSYPEGFRGLGDSDLLLDNICTELVLFQFPILSIWPERILKADTLFRLGF